MHVGVDSALHEALCLSEIYVSFFKSKTIFLTDVALLSIPGYFQVPCWYQPCL